jgi:hypothetical protein
MLLPSPPLFFAAVCCLLSGLVGRRRPAVVVAIIVVIIIIIIPFVGIPLVGQDGARSLARVVNGQNLNFAAAPAG